MKKIFILGVVMSVFFVAQSALAASFLRPVQLGKITFTSANLFKFESTKSNKGKFGNNKESKQLGLYEKGVACFGNGKSVLYFHYDAAKKVNQEDNSVPLSRFGDKDIKNSVQVAIGIPSIIWLVKNDSGMNFFLLEHGNDTDLGINHTLIGLNKDGRFVKYFDTFEVKLRYFESDIALHISDEWGAFHFDEGIIILRFKRDEDSFAEGEFRFKWDDEAKWFGVEKVEYKNGEQFPFSNFPRANRRENGNTSIIERSSGAGAGQF